MTQHPEEAGRLQNIDILRALSILLVVLSHFELSRGFPLQGIHGVALFFMISGYCMCMTAAGKSGSEFWLARWLRLVPTLLVCALLSTVIEKAFPAISSDRLHGWKDFAFSVVCIPAANLPCGLAAAVTEAQGRFSYVDGTYWSLMVEFRFYLLFFLVYYLARARTLAPFLILLTTPLAFALQGAQATKMNDVFGYMPFFAFGMGYFFMVNGANRIAGMAAAGLSVAVFIIVSWIGVSQESLALSADRLPPFIAAFAVFVAIMAGVRQFSANRLVALVCYIGVISYPLYLLHQDLGVMAIHVMTPLLGPAGAALATVGIMLVAAHVVHVTVERGFVGWLRGRIRIWQAARRVEPSPG